MGHTVFRVTFFCSALKISFPFHLFISVFFPVQADNSEIFI